MARNGSGTYSKVNTFVAGNTITAAGHNDNWDDLVTEMSNSVAADGQTTLTGALKGASGTVSLPAYSFSADLDCGMYRIGANNIGIAANGAKVLDIATTGLTVTGTLASSGALTTTSGGHTITAGGLTVTDGGVTVTAGNVAITAGDFAIATSKFTVANASGNTVVAGTLGVTGDVAVNTNKFTVAASTGNTVVAGTLAVTGAITASGGVTGFIAAQSDQETATSTTLAVSPGRQQFHPSASKVWINCDVSGTTDASYNVTSITDSPSGIVDVTIATDFSSAEYATLCTSQGDSNTALAMISNTTPPTAGTFRIRNFNAATGAGTDSAGGYSAAAFGDQA